MDEQTKSLGGRPTKYDPSLIEQVPRYLKQTGREQTILPTREGFAHFIGVHRDTVDEWCGLYPDFVNAVIEIDECQKQQLMNDGLYGGKEVNSTMAIFLLKVNHGMVETEKRLLEVTGDYNIIDDISGKRITKATSQPLP